jgi:drug/metabolite transporter (DMT)-like permease
MSSDALPPAVPSSSGYLALFGVAVLYGSYTPALRYMFSLSDPPSAALLNCLQACISALVLAAFSSLQHWTTRKESTESTPCDGGNPKLTRRRMPKNAVEKVMSDALNWTSSDIRLAGGELGLWMCLAFGLEIAGCELISATKTAFLNQATVLITPFLVFLSGARVRKKEWMACSLGLSGSLLVALDGLARISSSSGASGANYENPIGFALVLLSAFFLSMGTVRLGQYSSRFNSLRLSTAATVSLSLCSLVWVFVSIMGQGAAGIAETGQVLLGIVSNPYSFALLLWLGIGPGALAVFLQMQGQKTVPPAQAQVILATTPVFASGIAMIFLDAAMEAMGGIAWVGAGLMILASVVASTGSRPKKA